MLKAPHDPIFLVALALITLQKYFIQPVSFMLSVCPDLTESFNYSLPGRVSSYFVAYSSCDCSLSTLWDACPDPPWRVRLEVTLSMRLTAGSRASPCVSLALPTLSVHCSSPFSSSCPSIVWLQKSSPFRGIRLPKSFIYCFLSLTPYKAPAGVKCQKQTRILSENHIFCFEIYRFF